MNFTSNFASIAKSLTSTFASAATSLATTPKTPAATAQLPTTDVLRAAPKSDLSAAQWHSDSLAKTGIIIVSGKGGDKPTPPGTENGIIIVSGHDAPKHNSLAERGIIIVGGTPAHQPSTDSVKARLDNSMKGLEAQDRMGNFEIQRMMSAFNQAETLSSNVQKKMDDTVSGMTRKI